MNARPPADAPAGQAPGAIFHGWIVVGAVHVALFVIFGVAYSFAAFFSAFQAEFGASRGDIALVFSVSGLLYFLVGAFAGTLADRFGPRRVALAGMVLLALGLASAARATDLTVLYVTYGLGVGLGVGCVYVPAVGAVQPWFARRRGLASGLAAAGIGLGTLVVPLLATWLLGLVDWRRAFEILAIGALLLGGGAALLVESSPERRGLLPDGDRASAGAPRPSPRGLALGEAVRTRAFALWYASILFCSLGLFVPFVHLVPYARDAGLSEATGVFLMGLIGLGSLAGRFVLAGVGDRLPRPLLCAAFYGGMALMLLVWLATASALPLAIFALVFGACYGGFVALAPALAMDFFGARSVAGIIGVAYTAAGVGNLLGPWLAGVAYDLSGSYVMPISAAIVCMLGAVGFALALMREHARSAPAP